MGDLRLGRRALQGSPGLLEELREKGAGMASQFRMGKRLLHPELYDARGSLKKGAKASTEGFPKHLGGPRWQLSDGSIAKGNRAAAEAAQQALGA